MKIGYGYVTSLLQCGRLKMYYTLARNMVCKSRREIRVKLRLKLLLSGSKDGLYRAETIDFCQSPLTVRACLKSKAGSVGPVSTPPETDDILTSEIESFSELFAKSYDRSCGRADSESTRCVMSQY
jgi:hypothetical protein